MDILAGLSLLLAVAALVRLQGLAAAQRQQEARHRAEIKALRDELARLSLRPPAQAKLSARAQPVAGDVVPNSSLPHAEVPQAGWAKANAARASLTSGPFGSPPAVGRAGAVMPAAEPLAAGSQASNSYSSSLPLPPAGQLARPSSSSLYALGGALLVLVGMAFVLSQLAHAGFFTPQMQWSLAALLAAALYALSGRAAPAVAEAMRGLGYGLAALCLGALSLSGVLGAGPVLALVLLLSLLVGAHARRRGGVLLVGVAALGAQFAAWLLADNLGMPYAQYALLAVAGALLLCLHHLPAGKSWPHPLRLTALLPLGVAGLAVTAAWHAQVWAASGGLWALYLALVALGLHLIIKPKSLANKATDTPPAAFAAISVLLTGLLVTGLLTALARHALWWGPLGWWGLFKPYSLLLPALGVGLLGLVAARIDGAGRQNSNVQPDPLREALLMAALGSLSAWLTLDSQAGQGLALRLLPLAVMLALYGQWTAQRAWRWGGTLAGALLLVLLPPGWPALLLSFSALGAATRLPGAAGGVLGLAAAYPLLVSLLAWLPAGAAWWPAALSTLAGGLALLLAALRWPATSPGVSLAPLRVAAVGLATLLALYLLAQSWFTTLGQPAWWLLAFTLAGGVLAGLPHLPGVTKGLPPRWGAALPRVAEWAGLLLWLAGMLPLPASECLKGALLLLLALALPLLHSAQPPYSAQPWPAPAATLLGVLAAMTCWHALSLQQPLTGLALLAFTLLGLGALFSAQGAGWWLRRGTPAPWLAWPAGPLAALWGAVLSLLCVDAFVLLAAWWGLGGVLHPHALSATVGLLLPGLLMLWLSRRLGLLPLWTVGLVAFGLAAAKLMAFDLDGLGLSVRGLGLTVVGLLLLAIGQLAPRKGEQ